MPISESLLPHLRSNPARKLCGLVIGHKKQSPGAINHHSTLTEFDFNDDLSRRIEQYVQATFVQRVYRRTYRELPDDLNALKADFVIDLHCNSLNTKATGTEVLYYHKSEIGKSIAGILLNHLVNHLRLPNRGIKPKTSEDKGGYLLKYTTAPSVISEPFFIDNDNDLARANSNIEGFAAAYAAAIDAISKFLDKSPNIT
ncbi:MAG: hypothetical protein CO189_05775 [candidate division Zixibacteria bacterium CG_4_9_14_3_um_filter_46_8]|nr:MAG: hypothetical protein CO189_05775 [candidate division Zixibacteria bacterium CG_4_9_14_3_um_filter_46_8]